MVFPDWCLDLSNAFGLGNVMSTFIGHVIKQHPFLIRPAPVNRDWMDLFQNKHPYRCLPLNIANAHGWEILCTEQVTAVWNGKNDLGAIDVKEGPASSHFGGGILTFHVPIIFKTDPQFDLMVQGPINRFKDAIQPLSGVVETSWSPYTFTMNWKFTRPFTKIVFKRNEPFCHIIPYRRSDLVEMTPVLKDLDDNPELKGQYEDWSKQRSHFNRALKDPNSEQSEKKWQRQYFTGLNPDNTPTVEDHRTKLRLKEFSDQRGKQD